VEPGERRFYGIDFVKDAKEQVCAIQIREENLLSLK
jgi:hypothetical protein